tara:strand:+ start:2399 stop:2983 length:585 start_codon:yes stop_codon:yes gene_type:complete
MRLLPIPFLLSLALCFTQGEAQEVTQGEAQEVAKGIQGQQAPPLRVTEWIQLPEGTEQLDIPYYKGEILVMLMFQHTCEACHKRAFPTLQNLVKQFGDTPGVNFLAIQTPFEDFLDNTELKLAETAEKFDLQIPFGHLSKTPDFYSINAAYRTGGTPWWVIVNRDGVVEYDGFFLNPEVAVENLEKMIAGEPVD